MRRFVHILIIFILALGSLGALHAQTPRVNTLPEVTSTEGREFFVAWLPNGGAGPKSSDLKLTLLASSRFSTAIYVQYPDGTVSNPYPLAAGASIEIDIDPKLVYWDQAKQEEEKIIQKGIRVFSSNKETFTLYSTNQTGMVGTYSFDGAHILPVEALGTEYMVQTAEADATATEFVVMSTQPGQTNVTINLTTNSRVGNKQQLTFTFDGPRQIYIVRSTAPNPDDQDSRIDLSGSTICADKPVAVWSGNQQASIPNADGTSTDHAYDQLLPVNKWGKEFIVPLTGLHTQYNEVHVVSLEDNTTLRVVNQTGATTASSSTSTMTAGEEKTFVITLPLGSTETLDNRTLYVNANKPVQVYLFSSTGAYNQYQEGTKRYLQGDPSTTMIPPLEYMTDTTIFKTYNGGDKKSKHEMRIWARTADVSTIRLDGSPISTWRGTIVAPNYSIANVSLTDGAHVVTAPKKSFTGYVYGMNDGQAYMYPIGYDFVPKKDSLFLVDNNQEYPVFHLGEPSTSWKEHNISNTESGWFLDKVLLDNDKYRLDSISICDSTELTFPIKTYNPWSKVIWEIEGSIQGKKYFTPETQLASDVTRPELTHQFHLLPIETNKKPFEDFEVRGIVIHSPLFCDIPEDKWQRDTFNTVVHVVRQYNDTTWRILCESDTMHFFRDTVWNATHDEFTIQTEVYNDTANYTRGEYKYVKYTFGPNVPHSKDYISSGGCDSLSTLMLYVCETKNRTIDTTLCEDELKDLNAKLGDFFNKSNKIDFVKSFAGRASDSKWTQNPDGSWDFEGVSKLKTTSCMSDELMEYVRHGATYNGCDSTLTLKLNVKPVDIRAKSINICENSYVWKEDDGKIIRTITRKAGENDNTPYTYTHSIPYSICTNCPDEGCDSVRYELKLMFVDDNATDTIHLCQNEGPYAYTHKDDNTGEQYTWPAFDPRGKKAGEYSYEDQKQQFNVNGEGCRYYFHPVFIVDSVTTYRDSVVYCYVEGEKVAHTWAGHKNFWYNVKGSSRKTLGSIINASYPTLAQGRLIYELTDTVLHYGNDCDTIYNQVVILMPLYNVISPTHHMADDDVFEWDDRLLVGDQASGYSNPKGLEVVVMRPTGGTYPAKWNVEYDSTLKEYTIVNKTKTDVIHNEAGVAQSCDSSSTLYLRIGQKFDSTEYVYTCSSEEVYRWRGKNRAVPQGVTKPTTKIYYDSLKTKWPVIGLDSVYRLSLTVYPSYKDTTELVEVCQDRQGFQWEDHMGEGHKLSINGKPMDPSWDSIPIAKTGHYYITDSMMTKQSAFLDPVTKKISWVRCDSIWVLDLVVHEVYDSTFTYINLGSMVVKSNDTATCFSPKTLFIGPDFDYKAHGNKTPDELRIEAGADAVEILSRDSVYSKTGLSQYDCDSTTYIQVEICWLKEEYKKALIGDNDTTWTFGGDTTPDEQGVRQHTLPLVTGWDFHVDDDGNTIDYSSNGRAVRTREYVDTLHTAGGCDSIVHMSLKIYPSYRFDTVATTCHNVPFEWRGMKDLNMLGTDEVTSTVEVPAVYKTVQSGGLVDSVYVLTLTIRPGQLKFYHKDICYNETVLFYSIPITYDPDFELDSVVALFQPDGGESCGDKFVLYTDFKPAYGYDEDPNYNEFVDYIDVSQYDEFHWLDKNGKEHTENLRDSTGRKYTTIPTDSIGWHTIYDSLKTVSCNCDSIYTLHYYVDRAYRYETDTALCPGDQFIWVVKDKDGQDYTKDTIYSSDVTTHIYDTIHGQTVHGCDSSYYLHIFVDQPYDIYIDTIVCFEDQHFEWTGDNGLINYDEYITNSHYMTEPQEFFDTLRTQTLRGKCDSTMYLHLTIGPSADSTWTDTICVGETYLFYEDTLTVGGVYDVHIANEWGCDVRYELTLDAIEPTTFEVATDVICLNDINTDIAYTLRYTYRGEFQPISYSVRYDSLAADRGFVNQEQIPIPETLTEGQEYELYIPLPAITQKEDYPRPDHYTAKIAFENGVCEGDSLMTYPFGLNVNYPSWLMEQRHGDVIALLDSAYNGGYRWTNYQWFEGDSMLVGQTKPYLHIPTGLTPGALYHVELIRTGDSIAFPTCEIEAIANPIPNDYAPTTGYLGVTPTCIVTGHPSAYILSRKNGTYRVNNSEGQLVTEGKFQADVTEIQLPAVSGMYIIQLWSPDTPEEPYRAIKVLVREQCPNCDISSF